MLLQMLPRERYLLKTYGITLRQYDQLLKKQGGGCGVCNKTTEQEGRNLAVDHNHKTGHIRGLLCMYCNHRVIGRHTDYLLFKRAARYLEGTGTGWYVPEKKKKRKKRKRSRA